MKKILLTAAALLVASPAAAFMASNGYRVSGTAEAIRVAPLPGAGGSQVFCAAAEYARTHLGAATADKLTVITPRSKGLGRGNRTVVFRLSSGTQSDHGFLLSVSNAGETSSVAHVMQLCDPPRATADTD